MTLRLLILLAAFLSASFCSGMEDPSQRQNRHTPVANNDDSSRKITYYTTNCT